jgi:hypothetical protein
MPVGSGLGVVMVSPALMVTEKLVVAVFKAESVTFTPKVALPATGEEPESIPPVDRVNPIADRLVAPEVTDQLYPVPEPPAATNVRE